MITGKEWSAYLKAKKEWVSVNDAYNVAHFGITSARYHEISKLIQDKFGMFAPSTYSEIQKAKI